MYYKILISDLAGGLSFVFRGPDENIIIRNNATILHGRVE
jgi:hypothetical protein